MYRKWDARKTASEAVLEKGDLKKIWHETCIFKSMNAKQTIGGKDES